MLLAPKDFHIFPFSLQGFSVMLSDQKKNQNHPTKLIYLKIILEIVVVAILSVV